MKSILNRCARVGVVLAGLSTVACSDEPAVGARESVPLTSATLEQEMQADIDLEKVAPITLGDRGPAVRQAHRFFLRYGYFRNDVLAKARPDWSPVVDVVPADLETFGAELEAAVRAYQIRMALPESGVIDEATLAAMKKRTCGDPDTFEDDVEQKWDVRGGYLMYAPYVQWPWVNYLVTAYPPGIAASSVDAAVEAAMRTYGAWPRKSSSELGNNVVFKWTGTSGIASTDNATFQTITYNKNICWSLSAKANCMDIQSVTAHEFGHVAGFNHTSINSGSLMWPQIDWGSERRYMSYDDKSAYLASPYSGWYQWPGTVTHFAMNASSAAWALSTTSDFFGKTLLRWNGSSWTTVTGSGGGVKVALGSGNWPTPYVLTNNGFIYKRTGITPQAPTGSGYTFLSGTASDIATCPSADILFKLSTEPFNGDAANHQVSSYNAATDTWTNLPIGGVNLAVDGSTCQVWVAKANMTIFRLENNVAVLKPGLVRDIAGAPTNGRQIWGMGSAPYATPNDFGVYTWNEQASSNLGDPKPRARAGWLQTSGAGVGVAVGPWGPFVWNSGGYLWQRTLP